ncbi:MAG: hypothetical protein R6U95_03280, partial [Bacteroidales bacterium]
RYPKKNVLLLKIEEMAGGFETTFSGDFRRLTLGHIKQKKQPTHKTIHLQTAQTDTQPKFAKELFSCQRTHG